VIIEQLRDLWTGYFYSAPVGPRLRIFSQFLQATFFGTKPKSTTISDDGSRSQSENIGNQSRRKLPARKHQRQNAGIAVSRY
jgi:hypothetical protein